MKTKQQLRDRMLSKRRQLSEQEKQAKSQKIWQFLQKELPDSGVLMTYFPHNGEPDIPVMPYWLKRGQLLLPKTYMINGRYEIIPYELSELDDLQPGLITGIKEPPAEYPHEGLIDVVITPGVAFSPSGDRIGYGYGTFDRFFEMWKYDLAIGLAYEFQLYDQLPTNELDVPMDLVVTETGKN